MSPLERMVQDHGPLLEALATAYGSWEALGVAFGDRLSHANTLPDAEHGDEVRGTRTSDPTQ